MISDTRNTINLWMLFRL